MWCFFLQFVCFAERQTYLISTRWEDRDRSMLIPLVPGLPILAQYIGACHSFFPTPNLCFLPKGNGMLPSVFLVRMQLGVGSRAAGWPWNFPCFTVWVLCLLPYFLWGAWKILHRTEMVSVVPWHLFQTAHLYVPVTFSQGISIQEFRWTDRPISNPALYMH